MFAPQEHELVHAVRRGRDSSHRFLEEGVAEVWGDDSLIFEFRFDTDRDAADAAMSVDEIRLAGRDYGVAGRWVSHLAARGELAGLNALLDHTTIDSSYAELEREFEAAFGRTLQSDFELFSQEEPCDQIVFRDPVHPCTTAPVLEWCNENGESIPIRRTLSCADTDVLGPRDGEIWTYLAVDVRDEPVGSIVIDSGEPASGAYVEVQECAPGCASKYKRAPMMKWPVWQSLDAPPGRRYVLKLSQPQDVETDFEVYLQSESCSIAR